MQPIPPWAAPRGVLGALTQAALGRAAALRPHAESLFRSAEATAPGPPLVPALRAGPTVAVIAELKRRSPSAGVINDGLAADAQAAAYEAGGAAALSILTEPAMFGGALHDLHIAREGTALPLIRKDFLVDRLQLAEARAAGASGALLIARAVGATALGALVADARALGLEPVVEVRTTDELAWAVDAGATVIGVNTRDLETLTIDAAVGEALVPRIPRECVAVWESGVAAVDDVERAAAAGAGAVLVGSSLSAAADPVAAVRALAGVPRRRG